MKLEPGLYILSERSTFRGERCLYLKVYKLDRQIRYEINGGLPGYADKYGLLPLEGFKVVARLAKRPTALKGKTTVTWEDEKGRVFEQSCTDIQVLRNLFKEYPEVAKAIGSKKWK